MLRAMDPITVLYRDDAMVVVSKPSGIMVHRNKQTRDRTFLLQEVRDLTGRLVFPVHRLDRPTSGAIVFGFTSEDAGKIHWALKEPEALKEYVVLCRGETDERFTSERPLTNAKKEKQPARTDFLRIATFSRCSLLEARLFTGRRHQVRRHLARMAHQPIGDTKYGKGRINNFFRENYQLPRLFLHAHRLHFAHPRSDELMEFLAPLAPDLRGFLSRLPDVPSAELEARWGYALGSEALSEALIEGAMVDGEGGRTEEDHPA
jgi:tRNA pseudouridine65 synthase